MHIQFDSTVNLKKESGLMYCMQKFYSKTTTMLLLYNAWYVHCQPCFKLIFWQTS